MNRLGDYYGITAIASTTLAYLDERAPLADFHPEPRHRAYLLQAPENNTGAYRVGARVPTV